MSNTLRAEQEVAEKRQRRIALLARATQQELVSALKTFGEIPTPTMLRGPESGLVMVRGRMGGTGNMFNLGEASVSRATVRLASGQIGHAQRLGLDKKAVRLAAICDALGEHPIFATTIAALTETIASRLSQEDATRAEETAATRVDFFTMVRGDD